MDKLSVQRQILELLNRKTTNSYMTLTNYGLSLSYIPALERRRAILTLADYPYVQLSIGDNTQGPASIKIIKLEEIPERDRLITPELAQQIVLSLLAKKPETTHNELTQKTPALNRNLRDDAIQTLIDSGLIELSHETLKIYRLT